ncbi:MAG: hypothetical protein ABI629_18250 [bacterium]
MLGGWVSAAGIRRRAARCLLIGLCAALWALPVVARGDCGDGQLDELEQCDDGNTLSGDCCSASCEVEAAGGACTADDNPCTTDVCDDAGRCTYAPNDDPCDDGVFCNGADICAGGACAVHAGDPCAGGAACNARCDEVAADCRAPAGSVCADDANPCTRDACDGDGACVHTADHAGVVCRAAAGACDIAERCDGVSSDCPADATRPDGETCSDGNACTHADACAGGVCVGGPATHCGLCQTCLASGGCIAAPRSGCKLPTASGKSSLTIKDTADNSGDALKWRWLGGAETTVGDLANPLDDDDYALCLYAGANEALVFRTRAPAGETCGAKPCWTAVKNVAFKYFNGGLDPEGTQKALLQSGRAGSARMLLSGRGAKLSERPLGLPPLPLALPLRVQLQSENGTCFEARYAAPGINRGGLLTASCGADCDPAHVDATPAATSTRTALPAGTIVPGATRTPAASTGEVLPTIRPECLASGGQGSAADKIAAQFGRRLRHWASWVNNSSQYGYLPGSPLEPSITSPNLRYPAIPNALTCADNQFGAPQRCTRDLMTDFEHCEKKFLYEGQCTLDDWQAIWQWMGNPTMPVWGHCRGAGTTRCRADSECAGNGALCEKTCDVYLYGDDSGGDPLPPGSLPPVVELKPRRRAWEACRCYAEYFDFQIMDEWLAWARGYHRADLPTPTPAPAGTPTPTPQRITNDCFEAVFTQMGSDVGSEGISMACVGCCGPTCGLPRDQVRPCTLDSECGQGESCTIPRACVADYYRCHRGWNGSRPGNRCGTAGCELVSSGVNGTRPQCPAADSCPRAQVSCEAWFEICDSLNEWVRPIRYGARGYRGGL